VLDVAARVEHPTAEALFGQALLAATLAEIRSNHDLRRTQASCMGPLSPFGPWEYPHRGGRTKAMEERHPVLKRDYPLNEKNEDFWVDERESPYTEAKRFDWYRGYHVGGRS